MESVSKFEEHGEKLAGKRKNKLTKQQQNPWLVFTVHVCMVHYNEFLPLPNPLCQEALPNSTEMCRCDETVYDIGKGTCRDIS